MKRYAIGFWNLENLFDVADSPRRTEKLQRTLKNELKGWSEQVLNRKIAQLASIIQQFNNGKGPDILGVCEVENRHVLTLLLKALKPLNRRFEVAHADTQDKRGIDVAFLYDKKLFKADKTFFHFIVKRSATRDIVQVNFKTKSGRLLVLIGNHWPSRSGGRYESEPYRLIAGETLAYFHQRVLQVHGKETPVLAMGDFNDEPPDRSMVEHARCRRTSEKVEKSRTATFLNLMWPLLGKGIGTHYYDNAPNVLDQFLVSKSLLTGKGGFRLVEGSAGIYRFPEMLSPQGHPIRFGRGKSLNRNGFSDHFPIGAVLEEK